MNYAEALHFVENLTYLMEEKGLTKYRLAKLVPCSPSTIANWLNGIQPRGLMRTRLLEILNVSEDELFGDRTKKPASVSADGVKINPHYFDLSEEDRAVVDAMIERLSKAGQ